VQHYQCGVTDRSDTMEMKTEKRYALTDLTFEEIEVICLGLEELDGPDVDSERVLIAKTLTHTIDKELRT